MTTRQIQHWEFPVVGQRRIREQEYFVVRQGTREHLVKMYAFQRNRPMPVTLHVATDPNHPEFYVLDTDYYHLQFFKVGEVYPFTIQRSFQREDMVKKFYTISDDNGFSTRLYVDDTSDYAETVLPIGTVVHCRVEAILPASPIHVRLVSAEVDPDIFSAVEVEEEQLPDVSKEELNKSLLEQLGAHQYAEAIETIDRLSLLVEESQNQVDSTASRNMAPIQHLLRELMTWYCLGRALENWLKNERIEGSEIQGFRAVGRFAYQREERLLENFFYGALSLSNRWDNEISNRWLDLLESGLSLSSSDWHYCLTILGLQDGILDDSIRQSLSFKEESSQELQRQLVLAAISCLQVSDRYKTCLLLAALYPLVGTVQEIVMDAAWQVILGRSKPTLLPTWGELSSINPQLIAARMANRLQPVPPVRRLFTGAYGSIEISPEGITVTPTATKRQLKRLENLFGQWDRYIRLSVPDKVKLDRITWKTRMQTWKQIELSGGQCASSPRSMSYLAEDVEVLVRLDSLTEDHTAYCCTILGNWNIREALLPLSEMVRFNVNNPEVLLHRDKPVCFRARVLRLEDRLPILSIGWLVNQLNRDQVSTGQTIAARLKCTDERGCIWLSEHGFSIVTPTDTYEPGICCMVTVDQVGASNGLSYGHVSGTSNLTFNDIDAFCYIIDQLSEEAPAEEPAESTDFTNLSIDEIRLAMTLLEEKLEEEQALEIRYNGLALLRLMAHFIEDPSLYAYYDGRLKRLTWLDSYFKGEKPTLPALSEDSAVNRIAKVAAEQKLIRLLSLPWSESGIAELVKASQEGEGERERLISRLLLAASCLSSTGLAVEPASLRREIADQLGLQLPPDKPVEVLAGGCESIQVEFKTSLAYPSGNGMRPDPKVQGQVIVRNIAGMLNSEGGTLYLGVNDRGVPVGLAPDLDFFTGKDAFVRQLHDLIRQYLGMDINAVLKASWVKYGEYEVYVLQIPAYHTVVRYLPSGKVYARQQTSTIELNDKSIELLYERKRKRFGDSITCVVEETAPAVTPEVPEPAPANRTVSDRRAELFEKPFFIQPYEMMGQAEDLYLHYLTTDEYLITDRPYRDARIGLSVPFSFDNRELIQLFNDGRLCRTPLKELADKKLGYAYKLNDFRYTDLSGVSLIRPGSKVFTAVMRDERLLGKVIDSEIIDLHKDLTTAGKPLSNVRLGKFVCCGEVPADYAYLFSRIIENRITYPGFVLNSGYCDKELQTLQGLFPMEAVYTLLQK